MGHCGRNTTEKEDFMKYRIKCLKKKVLRYVDRHVSIAYGLIMSYILVALNKVNVYAEGGLSENLGNAANGAQQEVLGWTNAAGLIGIVITGGVWLMGNSKLAKSIIMGLVIAYVLVKFAPDLWTWFTSIF